MMRGSGPILLVEDDVVDIMAVQRALDELNIKNSLTSCYDGEQALQYLRDEDKPCPSLVMLDLNMPRMNGFEFLRIIKTDEQLKMIPTIILTTSNRTSDVRLSYKLGAAGYIVKSANYRGFVEAISVVDRYWSMCLLPSQICAAVPA